MPQPGDKVTLCGVDLIFGNWEPSENYTTQYNVQIGRTVGECASNLVAAINCADNRYGGYHLNRMITPVFARQYGRFAHMTVRNLADSGSGVSLSVSSGGRLVVYVYGEADTSFEQNP